MAEESSGVGKLMGVMLVFVAVGAPFVVFVWHTLSDLLSGRFEPGRLSLAGVFLVILIGLVSLLARYLSRMTDSG